MDVSRMKYRDLGVNPETGVPRREYVGLMDDEEWIAAIMVANGAQDDPGALTDLPDLDAGEEWEGYLG